MGEKEDWWLLDIDDETGDTCIIHEWNHSNLKNLEHSQSGSDCWSVKTFLARNQPPQEAKDNLLTMLAEKGIDP